MTISIIISLLSIIISFLSIAYGYYIEWKDKEWDRLKKNIDDADSAESREQAIDELRNFYNKRCRSFL